MVRQKRKLGDILCIDLKDGTYAFGRVLSDASVAFYNYRINNLEYNVGDIIKKRVIFIIGVYDDIITRGTWKVVGNYPLEKEFEELPPKYIKDPITKKFSQYKNGAVYPSTREECVGLESASIWEAHAVEERLRDFFNNKENRVVLRDKKDFE